MGLTWIETKDGRTGPILVCDACGERILQSEHQGMARCMPDGVVKFLHKNYDGRTCDDGSVEGAGWTELDAFFGRVSDNVGLNPKSWPKQLQLLDMLP